MATMAYKHVHQLRGYPLVTVTSKGEALEATVRRGEIEVRVVVPEDILEWFVEAELRSSGLRATDWYDYEGYDETPLFELEAQMVEDVVSFLDQG